MKQPRTALITANSLLYVVIAETLCLFGVNAFALDLVRDGKAFSTIVLGH